MTTPTKLWITICAIALYTAAAWYHGYHTADANWQKKEAERKLADATATAKLSEEYRLKERKLNETIGQIETRAINDAANAEMEYKAVVDRLRNARANPFYGLRVKSELTCRSVHNVSTPTSNGNEEVQGGLSPEAAERIIGIGHECDKVVLTLQACQEYVDSIRAP